MKLRATVNMAGWRRDEVVDVDDEERAETLLAAGLVVLVAEPAQPVSLKKWTAPGDPGGDPDGVRYEG